LIFNVRKKLSETVIVIVGGLMREKIAQDESLDERGF
jgi:hypothetical protein